MSSPTLKAETFATTEQLRTCPNCNGENLKRYCVARDRLHEVSSQWFQYSICSDCRLLFLSIRPAELDAYQFYPEDYAPHTEATKANSVSIAETNPKLANPLFSLANRAIGFVNARIGRLIPNQFPAAIEEFYKPPHPGAVLLDFGCGSDKFLNWARSQGWETVGIDFASRSVSRVRASGHRAFLMSPTIWNEIEDESLDRVRMSHVLEHLYRPGEILAALVRKLKPGGRLHIALPNPRGAAATIFGGRWRGLDCPRHVALYPPATVSALIAEFGLGEISLVYEIITKDLAGSLAYLLRDMRLVRRETAARMVTSPGLSAFLYTPAQLAGSLGRGDVFHVFARKPNK